jgi:DNA primase
VFCFDGDRAGRAAAWRALENSVAEVKQGRQIRFLFLPDGHDPDSLVREEGADAFEARLAHATPLSEYLLTELASRTDAGSVDGRAKLVELARPLLRRIPSDVYRELLTTQLAEAVRMAPARLAELLGAARAPADKRTPPRAATPYAPPATVSTRGNLVRQAIALLVHYPAAARSVDSAEIDGLLGIERAGVPLLVELLSQLREDPPASTAILLERWRDRPDHAPLAKLAATELLVADQTAAEAELQSAIRRLVAEEMPGRRLDELLAKARDGELDPTEKAELQRLLRSRAQPQGGDRTR